MSTNKRDQLINEGYCIWENILDDCILSRITEVSDRLLDAKDPTDFHTTRSTGWMICVWDDPAFGELIGWQPALGALESMGYDRPTFSTGFVISKPPHSPPLFWHQDWWGWDDPHSYTAVPQQIFLMYYLVDTTPENGCLRLIPGSHLKRHAMHCEISEAHTVEIKSAEDLDDPVYGSHPDELEVCVNAGDLVMGDSRLLHSARGNTTDQRRTVITLWYQPSFCELPECMQAYLGGRDRGARTRIGAWPDEAQVYVQDLMPVYDGEADALEWNRTPGPMLK